ncbi:hypothetical protein, partial [Cysteiniphilum litorale]|uniref:hypothetical protein n=1 Tax=Cysteiniphilum litorale TaxID=2056700 RepID=UPI003F883DE2
GAHTWLATVDLNVSPQSHEELDPFLAFLLHFVFSFKRQKKSQVLSFTIDRICKSPFTAKSPFMATNEIAFHGI